MARTKQTARYVMADGTYVTNITIFENRGPFPLRARTGHRHHSPVRNHSLSRSRSRRNIHQPGNTDFINLADSDDSDLVLPTPSPSKLTAKAKDQLKTSKKQL